MTIRDARLAKKMTQGELAKAVGVDPAMISRYENGQTKPSAKKLLLMAPILSVPIDMLLLEYGYSISPHESRRTGESIILSVLSDHFLLLGMPLEKNIPYKTLGFRQVDVDLLYRGNGKQWAFEVAAYQVSLSDEGRKHVTDTILSRQLLSFIGHMCFIPSINKASMVTDAPLEQLMESVALYQCPDNLRFDLSIIHIDPVQRIVDAEFELLTHYDGSGFFDLTVPGKEADSARMLAAWKTSLSNPRPKTN